MIRYFFSLGTLLCCLFQAAAQVAPPATYILFNSQNMDILDYRPAYANSTTKYYAYNFKPSGNDQYILYSGSGVNMDYLPTNSVNSNAFIMTDDIFNGVNKVSRQLFVVLQQQRGYIVAPVTNVTKVTSSGKFVFVNGLNYSFVFDTDNVSMGRELSTAGSAASVALNSFGYKSCKYQYSFKRTPNATNAEMAEFEFIPKIGIVSERSGRNTTEMQANQVNLWSINGLTLDDYIAKECGTSANSTANMPPAPAPLPGNVVAPTDPRVGDPQTAGTPDATAPPTGTYYAYFSAISKYPASNCGKVAQSGYHIVQPKETVNGIARFYGTTVANILKWNNIKDANKIEICQELKIVAPGGKVNKGWQPIVVGLVNNNPNATPSVTPPPASNPTQPNYVATQPGTTTQAPGMFVPGNGNNNMVYPSPQPLADPTVKVPPTNSGNTLTSQYYEVRPGEGVSGIARKFGFTEERFRVMNNFPASGNVPLKVGQKVKVSDCEVFQSSVSAPPVTPAPVTSPSSPTATYPIYVPPVTTPVAVGNTGVPVLTQPVGTGTVPQPNTGLPTGALPPITSSTTPAPGTAPGFVPVGSVPVGTQPVTTPPATTEPAKVKREPIGFKDYFVKDSETIKDIARKLGFDAAELALINGRSQDEKLTAGTRLQLPIY